MKKMIKQIRYNYETHFKTDIIGNEKNRENKIPV